MFIRSGIFFWAALAVLLPRGAANAQAVPDAEQQRLLEADTRSLLHAMSGKGTFYATTSLADMQDRDERTAPAHIEIITAHQLEAFGVRSLYEALQLIPGLSAGLDMDDVTGTGIHGNWAMEGKCLFMLDGKQLNENDFGTYAVGNRVPMANVERIEVLLGPGTALFGGYAELGVVNIVTRSAEQGQGSKVHYQGGLSNGAHTSSTASISGAQRLSGQQDISYLVSRAQGNRSNASYPLPDGMPVNLADSTGFTANTFQLAYRWRNLKASTTYMEEQFHVAGQHYLVQMRDVMFALEQRTDLGRKLQLAWLASIADQAPWYYLNTDAPEQLASNTTDQRISAQAMFIYKPWECLSLRLGGQGYNQTTTYQWQGAEDSQDFNGKPSISFHSLAWIAEAAWHNRLGDLMAGYRQEEHALAGRFAAPRFAFTRVIGRFHGKLLWTEGYRIPALMNLAYGPGDMRMQAEHAATAEAELGFRFGKAIRLTANAYRTAITNPIVYSTGGPELDNYTNRPFSGTEGMDGRLQLEARHISLLAGAGAYRVLQGTDLPEAQINLPGATTFRALPGLRAFAALAVEAKPWLSLRGRAQWQSTRWSLQHTGAPDPGLVEWPAAALLNTGITLRPGQKRRLVIDLGCDNLLDTPNVLLDPQSNLLMPFRRNGRQWTLGLTYKFVQ